MMFKTASFSLLLSFFTLSAVAAPVTYMEAIFACSPLIQGKTTADLTRFDVNLRAEDREYRLPEGALKLVERNFVLTLKSGASVILGTLSEDPKCEEMDHQAHGVWSSITLNKDSRVNFSVDANTSSCEHDAQAAVFKRTERYTLEASEGLGSFSWSEVVTSASPYACAHP